MHFFKKRIHNVIYLALYKHSNGANIYCCRCRRYVSSKNRIHLACCGNTASTFKLVCQHTCISPSNVFKNQ